MSLSRLIDLLGRLATAGRGGGDHLALVLVIGSVLACQAPEEAQRRFLVVGIDGAEWRVIERLWAEGRLPVFETLAETGATARLRTAFEKSPVIWTTMATGVHPSMHGITGFVVPSAEGDVPVNSSIRRVPAFWNMATEHGLRTAVFGWWATWPVEAIDGLMVSDLALDETERTAWPPQLQEELPNEIQRAIEDAALSLPRSGVGARDRVMSHLALAAAGDPTLRLAAVYFRSLDIVSHFSWKYHQPERFGVTDSERSTVGDPVADVYEQVDRTLGLLLDRFGPDTNVIVVSDHGFEALTREELIVQLDFDALLEKLSYLERSPSGGVDLERSRCATFRSRPASRRKWIRFNRRLTEDERRELASSLRAKLAKVHYSSGAPVFAVREPNDRERRRRVDLVARVRTTGVSDTIHYGGTPLGLDLTISQLSGSHSRTTPGILLASGPDFDPDATLEGVRIHDFLPTLLYGLGLPVADDFVGSARTDLYREDFRRRHPLVSIPSWGSRPQTDFESSAVDHEELRRLRSLGYID